MALSEKTKATFKNDFEAGKQIFLLANVTDLLATLGFLNSGVDEGMHVNRRIVEQFGFGGLIVWKTIATIVPLVLLNMAFSMNTRELSRNQSQSLVINTLRLANIGIAFFAVAGATSLILNENSTEVSHFAWQSLRALGLMQ